MNESQTVYAVLAKTDAGREFFVKHWAQTLPSTFPAPSSAWFCASDHGFAIYAAEIDSRTGAALSFAGRLYSDAGLATIPTVHEFIGRGNRALDDLSGEFATIFWDPHRREIMIARDQMGQREIFVREEPHFYIVCSELEPLLADEDFDCELDFESAVHYLMFGVPAPGRTLAKRITRVPAGHYAVWRMRGPILRHRYFTPLGFEAKKVPSDEEKREIAEALDRAISGRIADGRQAILLSGGVDSSYIACTAAMLADGGRFDSYTIEFSKPYPHNEGDYAERVAVALGMRHHRISFDPAQACTALSRVLESATPCSAWASMTHHHLLSQIRADGHHHLLSGLGADEVFGGYWNYFLAYSKMRSHEENWPVGKEVAAIDGLMWDPTASNSQLFAGIPRFFQKSAQRNGLKEPYRNWSHGALLADFYRECRSLKPNAHLFELMVAHECQHRIPELLFAGFETIGRKVGINTAYPFLSSRVATLACGLGASERFWLKEQRWQNKKVLREIAANRVPETVLNRPLFSYTAPISMWAQHRNFSDALKARLRESKLWDTNLVDRAWLEMVEQRVFLKVPSPRSKQFTYVDQMWALVTLAAWYDRWVGRKP